MKSDDVELITIRDLITFREKKLLTINWEYQRGAVWSKNQVLLFIDSILREYQTPLIYLRKIEVAHGGLGGTSLEIIDGQQRINALYGFVNNVFIKDLPEGSNSQSLDPLIDPKSKKGVDLFPISLQQQSCDWADKKFKDFSDEEKSRFMNSKVPVVRMECTDDETRDLFIRLQGGSYLSAQEVRDSWPGNFCKLVIEIGGKPQQNHKEGHAFFRTIMNLKPSKDRGKTRQHAAQFLMLFLSRRENKGAISHSIDSKVIDSYYRQHVGLDENSNEVKRFIQILDKLEYLFKNKFPPLKAHDALHLILLADTLGNDYTPRWEDGITQAYENFATLLTKAHKIKSLDEIDEQDKELIDVFEYYQKTKASSDKRETIERRHEIYVRHMFRWLGDNLVIKDSVRGFPDIMREIIYYRAKKKCFSCKGDVAWSEAEIHHKLEHSKGGETTLDNGVLMHRDCHRELHKKNS